MAGLTVSLRITLRYKDVDEFAKRYAENISLAGLFLRTRTPKPPGTKVKFDLTLSNGQHALKGDGVVVSIRQDDKPGMAIRFNVLDETSWATVERVVGEYGQGALAPTPLSTPFRRGASAARGKSTTRRLRTSIPRGGSSTMGGGVLPRGGSWGPGSEDPAPARPSESADSHRTPISRGRSTVDRPWARGATEDDPSELHTQRIKTRASDRPEAAPKKEPRSGRIDTREFLQRAHDIARSVRTEGVAAFDPLAPSTQAPPAPVEEEARHYDESSDSEEVTLDAPVPDALLNAQHALEGEVAGPSSEEVTYEQNAVADAPVDSAREFDASASDWAAEAGDDARDSAAPDDEAAPDDVAVPVAASVEPTAAANAQTAEGDAADRDQDPDAVSASDAEQPILPRSDDSDGHASTVAETNAADDVVARADSAPDPDDGPGESAAITSDSASTDESAVAGDDAQEAAPEAASSNIADDDVDESAHHKNESAPADDGEAASTDGVADSDGDAAAPADGTADAHDAAASTAVAAVSADNTGDFTDGTTSAADVVTAADAEDDSAEAASSADGEDHASAVTADCASDVEPDSAAADGEDLARAVAADSASDGEPDSGAPADDVVSAEDGATADDSAAAADDVVSADAAADDSVAAADGVASAEDAVTAGDAADDSAASAGDAASAEAAAAADDSSTSSADVASAEDTASEDSPEDSAVASTDDAVAAIVVDMTSVAPSGDEGAIDDESAGASRDDAVSADDAASAAGVEHASSAPADRPENWVDASTDDAVSAAGVEDESAAPTAGDDDSNTAAASGDDAGAAASPAGAIIADDAGGVDDASAAPKAGEDESSAAASGDVATAATADSAGGADDASAASTAGEDDSNVAAASGDGEDAAASADGDGADDAGGVDEDSAASTAGEDHSNAAAVSEDDADAAASAGGSGGVDEDSAASTPGEDASTAVAASADGAGGSGGVDEDSAASTPGEDASTAVAASAEDAGGVDEGPAASTTGEDDSTDVAPTSVDDGGDSTDVGAASVDDGGDSTDVAVERAAGADEASDDRAAPADDSTSAAPADDSTSAADGGAVAVSGDDSADGTASSADAASDSADDVVASADRVDDSADDASALAEDSAASAGGDHPQADIANEIANAARIVGGEVGGLVPPEAGAEQAQAEERREPLVAARESGDEAETVDSPWAADAAAAASEPVPFFNALFGGDTEPRPVDDVDSAGNLDTIDPATMRLEVARLGSRVASPTVSTLGGAVPEPADEDDSSDGGSSDLALQSAQVSAPSSDEAQSSASAETVATSTERDSAVEAPATSADQAQVDLDVGDEPIDPIASDEAASDEAASDEAASDEAASDEAAVPEGLAATDEVDDAAIGAEFGESEEFTEQEARIPEMRRVRSDSGQSSPVEAAELTDEETPSLSTQVSVTGVGVKAEDTDVSPKPEPSFRPGTPVGPRKPAVELDVSVAAGSDEQITEDGPTPVVAAEVRRTVSLPPPPKEDAKASQRIIGIDLGGRIVRAGMMSAGELSLIDIDGESLWPSFVAVSDGDAIVVGQEAAEIRFHTPKHAASIIELLRGLDNSPLGHPDIRGIVSRDNNGRATALLAGQRVAVADLLYAYLRHLVVSLSAGEDADRIRAMIAVPHELPEASRSLLTEVSAKAGLDIIEMVSEPLAMVRAYHLAVQGVETVLTVDLGATHMGVAVVRRGRDGFFVLESRWDPELSAEVLDTCVAELALGEVDAEIDQLAGTTRAHVMQAIENARLDMRRDATMNVELPLPEGDSDRPKIRRVKLPRSRVYQVSQAITDRVIVAARAALTTAGVHPKAVGAVLTSGSAGSYPPLVGALTTMTGKEPLQAVAPTELVVLGLADAGDNHANAGESARPDSLNTAVGIGLPGGRFKQLIVAGSKLPATVSRRQSTTRDDQTEVELNFYQGHGDVVAGCTHIGTIAIKGVPKGPRGNVAVDVQVKIDLDAVLVVTLSEVYSGKKMRLTVPTQQTSGTRRQQIQRRASLEDLSGAPKQRPKTGFLSRFFGR